MNCLLLNKDYSPISILPLSIVNWQHAIKLMFLDRITVLESYEQHVAHSSNLAIHYPAVAVTNNYFDNKRKVKFSRSNLYLRDLFTCAYCNETFDYNELTIDHVRSYLSYDDKTGVFTWVKHHRRNDLVGKEDRKSVV